MKRKQEKENKNTFKSSSRAKEKSQETENIENEILTLAIGEQMK